MGEATKKVEKKIKQVQDESNKQKLAQQKQQQTTVSALNSEMSSIKTKLKSTQEELDRDEEGIKLLQKMVDDRKADVTKLSQQVQSEKVQEKNL